MNAVALFQSKAPAIIAKLRGDFPLAAEDGEAIVGNAGHECDGFSLLQEIAPTVKGSKGGWGWFQWTGARRRAFEAYCARNKLDPASDKANYAWLFLELCSSEKGAVAKTRAAPNLSAKVVAFEEAYERAGVKNYPSRVEWASKAKTAYEAAGSPVQQTPANEQLAALRDEGDASESRANTTLTGAGATGVGGGSIGVATAQHLQHLSDWLLLGVFGLVVVGAIIALVVISNRHSARAADLHDAADQISGGERV